MLMSFRMKHPRRMECAVITKSMPRVAMAAATDIKGHH